MALSKQKALELMTLVAAAGVVIWRRRDGWRWMRTADLLAGPDMLLHSTGPFPSTDEAAASAAEALQLCVPPPVRSEVINFARYRRSLEKETCQ